MPPPSVRSVRHDIATKVKVTPLHSFYLLTSMPDRITISSLTVHLAGGLGPSAFNLDPPPPCPVLITVDCTLVPTCVPSCADNDTMSNLGVNYSALCKAVYAEASRADRIFRNPSELLETVAAQALALDAVDSVNVILDLPRASLPAQRVKYGRLFTRSSNTGAVKPGAKPLHWCEINTLQVACVIGLHPHERKERQRLEADLRVWAYGPGWDHKVFADRAFEVSFAEAVHDVVMLECVRRELMMVTNSISNGRRLARSRRSPTSFRRISCLGCQAAQRTIYSST